MAFRPTERKSGPLGRAVTGPLIYIFLKFKLLELICFHKLTMLTVGPAGPLKVAGPPGICPLAPPLGGPGGIHMKSLLSRDRGAVVQLRGLRVLGAQSPMYHEWGPRSPIEFHYRAPALHFYFNQGRGRGLIDHWHCISLCCALFCLCLADDNQSTDQQHNPSFITSSRRLLNLPIK